MSKTTKLSLVLTLLYSILIFLLLLIPKILVQILKIIESISRILKNTLSFFIEQVKKEALIYNDENYGKERSKESS